MPTEGAAARNSVPAIVGGVVGSLVVLAAIIVLAVLAGALLCVMRRKRKRRQWCVCDKNTFIVSHPASLPPTVSDSKNSILPS